jgi:hypothetical protein
MTSLLPEYRFFSALAAGVIITTVFLASPVWYLNLILLILVFGSLILTRTWRDRGFYLVCSGIPLVVACSLMNLWAGLFTICMGAGIVCSTLGLLESRQDLIRLGFFWGCSFLTALLIQISNHVLFPLIILGGITALFLAVRSVRMYQFRKHYAGA